MDRITVTCTDCGKEVEIEDTPDAIKNPKCPVCGGSMIVKRPPGDVSHMLK